MCTVRIKLTHFFQCETFLRKNYGQISMTFKKLFDKYCHCQVDKTKFTLEFSFSVFFATNFTYVLSQAKNSGRQLVRFCFKIYQYCYITML
jgi:hypothetical protein